MVEFIASELGEDGSRLRDFYGAVFDGSPLPTLPWGDAAFDCILVSPREPSRTIANAFSDEIVKHAAVDWVQTTGPSAEFIHDLVDEAAVADGRQANVGDGDPMTSWHDDAVSLSEIAEVAHHCFGAAGFVLCLVVGNQADLQSFAECLARSLRGAA